MNKNQKSRAVTSIRSAMTLGIHHFHEKFGLNAPIVPQLLGNELFEFRLKFLREEVQEYEDAHREGDLVKAFDALVDLVYVALGTSYLHGLPFEDGFDLVQAANMAKVRAERKEMSVRGSTYDVVKPEGWQPPDLRHLVGAFQTDAF